MTDVFQIRRPFVSHTAPGDITKAKDVLHARDINITSLEPRNRWMNQMKRLEQNNLCFFFSDDAKLLRTSKIWREKGVYEGLGVTFENCLALRAIHRIYFRSKELEGHVDNKGFERISCTVSQYLRLCVARSMCDKREVWKQETLFTNVANLELLRCFVEFNVKCRQGRTVLRKARHLLQICAIGSVFSGPEVERSDLHRSSRYLENIIKGVQVPSRQCRLSQAEGVISLDKIREYCGQARRTLATLIEWQEEEALGISALNRREQLAVVKEWYSAFVSFLILCSGGQSPQALAQAQISGFRSDENAWRQLQESGFVLVRTLRGRRTQSIGLPHIMLPRFVIPFLRFHILHINPIIHRLSGKSKETNYLLLNVKDGSNMKSEAISYAFNAFASQVCLRRKRFSARKLKKSFISILMNSHRQKRVFRNLS
ncbi:hypothetical protein FGB62_9g011 [Gracilaria domingensis]|nr:hypothetical protein FGB62_9g011 [Gracilaria domingensis]